MDPNNFRHQLVTGDETWVYHHDPKTKHKSMQWIEQGKRPPVEAGVVESAGKVMLTHFLDAKGPLLADFMPLKAPIAGQYYASILLRLYDALKEKPRTGVLLFHDNTPMHKVNIAKQCLIKVSFPHDRKILSFL